MLVNGLHRLYHQQTKNPLVSYSPKKLGFFWRPGQRRLTEQVAWSGALVTLT
ncbi:hypothetical protein [Streptomyces olivaceus]|uniref:hypothetical protein n=1 Tax=Streptomyces olivaceus TaxID=47716 RepID=UPI00188574DF|nr:hypothetical protein [Streptomyces olivaceus]